MKPLFIAAGIALTVTCWGMYGPVLHKGQEHLGNNRIKPLICVGAAYFIVAIILPLVILASRGQLHRRLDVLRHLLESYRGSRWRVWRNGNYPGFDIGWAADLRDAARVRRRAGGQRLPVDVLVEGLERGD